MTVIPCQACGKPRMIGSHYRAAARRCCSSCVARLREFNLGKVTAVQQSEIDYMAVERLLMGHPVTSTRAERQEAVRVLLAKHFTNAQIAQRIHASQRTVERLRSRLAA